MTVAQRLLPVALSVLCAIAYYGSAVARYMAVAADDDDDEVFRPTVGIFQHV